MSGDTWRITRRRVPLCGMVYQVVVVRGNLTIPVGPFAETLEELTEDCRRMLSACHEAKEVGLVEYQG